MRAAIYHNLPPGGALRVLDEFVRRTRTEHEYDLYTVDLGLFDTFAYARDRAEQHDPSAAARHTYRYPVAPAALPHPLWVATAGWWMDRVQRRIAADINRRGYDVALVHPCRVTHTPAILRYLEVPALHYMHEHRRRSFEAGYQTPDPAAPLGRRAAAGLVERDLRRRDLAAARAAGRIVCNSHYTAECIRRSYGRDATVCYPGVDGATFDVGPEPPRRGPSVVSVGALERVKGHDLIVAALALLPPASRPALDLVYERVDPAFAAEVGDAARAAGVELRLHRGISDADLAGLYRRASATVVAARLEPLGLVPLESLACGTAVVAVREAGYRETVDDGVNGYLVPRSPAALADGISRVLAGGLGRTPDQLRATVIPAWGWEAAVKRQLEQLAITAEGR